MIDEDDDSGVIELQTDGLRQLFEMSLPELTLDKCISARPLGLLHKKAPLSSSGLQEPFDQDDDNEVLQSSIDDQEIEKATEKNASSQDIAVNPGEDLDQENPEEYNIPASDVKFKLLCAEMEPGSGWQSGKFVWPAAEELCRYIGSDSFVDQSIARGDRITRILELGTGSGLVGIFLARLQARLHKRRGYVVLTDRDPFLLDMIKRTLKINSDETLPVETAELSWGATEPSLDALKSRFSRRPFDLIVAADVMYSTAAVKLLFETIDEIFRHSEMRGVQTQFVLCSSFCVQETTNIVIECCKRYGIERELLKNEIPQMGCLLERFVRAPTESLGGHQNLLQQTLKSLRQDEYGPFARIQSIHADAGFVEHLCSSTFESRLPVFANLRNGAWYTNSEGCYFKSTDGHVNHPTFAARRLNIQVLEAACAAARSKVAVSFFPELYTGGVVLVDATRRGKRFPDSFSRTVPIWCFVLNQIAGHTDSVLDLPPWVPKSEYSALASRFEEWKALVPAPALDVIRSAMAELPPLRPVWVCCDGTQNWLVEARDTDVTLPAEDTEAPCVPIVCLSASVAINADTEREFRQSWRYIPGAGDDHEMWASDLNPLMFWRYRKELVACRSNEECEALIAQFSKSQVNTMNESNDSTCWSSLISHSHCRYALCDLMFADDSFFTQLDASKHVLFDLQQKESKNDKEWEKKLPHNQTVILQASPKVLNQRDFWQRTCLPRAYKLATEAKASGRTLVLRTNNLSPERACLAVALACFGVMDDPKADIKVEVNAALFHVTEAAGTSLAQPPSRKLLKNIIVFLHDSRRIRMLSDSEGKTGSCAASRE